MATIDETKKALQDVLKIIAENPTLADRITITIKPSKIEQGSPTKDK